LHIKLFIYTHIHTRTLYIRMPANKPWKVKVKQSLYRPREALGVIGH